MEKKECNICFEMKKIYNNCCTFNTCNECLFLIDKKNCLQCQKLCIIVPEELPSDLNLNSNFIVPEELPSDLNSNFILPSDLNLNFIFIPISIIIAIIILFIYLYFAN